MTDNRSSETQHRLLTDTADATAPAVVASRAAGGRDYAAALDDLRGIPISIE